MQKEIYMNQPISQVEIKLCKFKNTVDVSSNGQVRSYGFSYSENKPYYMNYNNLPECERSSNLATAYWLGCLNDEGNFLDTNEFSGYNH